MESMADLFRKTIFFIPSLIVGAGILEAQPFLLEAEEGTLLGENTKIENSLGGYSGSGYVNGFQDAADGLTLSFNLGAAGEYSLFIGYSAPYGYKENFIDINGSRVDTAKFEQYDGFAEMFLGDFPFVQGENTITFSHYWGWCIVDYLRVSDISPRGNFTIDPPAVATGDTITFEASGTYDPNGTIVSYEWDFGDGAMDTGLSAEHVFTTEGEKLISLVVTDNDGNSTTITKTVDVARTEPYAVFSYSEKYPAPNVEISFDGTLSYDLTGTVDSYEWDFGDGNTSTGSVALHTFTSEGNFEVTLTVTNNRGKTNNRKMVLFVYDGAVILRGPVLISNAPKTHEKIELAFQVKAGYTNPFDPEQVKVDAVISLPGGDSLTVPCFFYQGANYHQGEWNLDTTNYGWRLRFLTRETGDHTIKLKFEGAGSEVGPEYTVNVVAGDSKGIIRNVESNNQYYKHETGEVYNPLGINIGWNDMDKYGEILANISQYHGNFFRYWHTPFARQALEWSDNYFYSGLGRYNQIAAGMTDSLLNLGKELDVYMQLVLFQHGPFSENVNEMWDENPYNTANGGFVDRAEEFFRDDSCKNYTKKLLRYIVARWGYSPNIFAWEFFNEVQFTGINSSQSAQWFPGVVQWHSEMSKYVASIDAFDHIMTTSAENSQLTTLDTIHNLDVLQYHLYSEVLLDQQKNLDHQLKNDLYKGTINGEYGEDIVYADVPLHKQQISLWNSIMTEVPHIMWLWDNYHRTEWGKLFYYPGEYLKGEDFALFDTLQQFDFESVAEGVELKTSGINGDSNYYGVVYNENNPDQKQAPTLKGLKLPYGYYSVENYIPGSNKITKTDSVPFIQDLNSLKLPEFSVSLAFKLKYCADYIDPIALAGADQVQSMGVTIILDGSESFDPQGGTLSYSWDLFDKPESSIIDITGKDVSILEFDPDVSGRYYFSLTVNNGTKNSLPDTVLIIASSKPVADAGDDGTIRPRKYFSLDGTGSYDPDGDAISYSWSVDGSTTGTTILNPTEPDALFRANEVGEYHILLVVNDGVQNSEPDTVVVKVTESSLIKETENRSIMLYPNPACTEVYVKLVDKNSELATVELFDTYGKLMLVKKINPGSNDLYGARLDISSMKQGIYMLRISSKDNLYVEQLIID